MSHMRSIDKPMYREHIRKTSTRSPFMTRSWLPLLLVVFVIMAGLSAAVGKFMTALAVLGVAAATLLLAYPDAATLLVIFLIYSNLAVLGVKFHGLPAIASMMTPMLLLVPLFYHMVIRREKIIVPSSLPWLTLFMMVLMVSTLISRDIPTAFDELFTYLTEGFLLYVLVTNAVRSTEQLRRVIWVLLAVGVILGGVPLYQQATETFNNNYGGLAQVADASFRTGATSLQGQIRQPRLSGAIGEMNRFAQVMLMLVPLGLMRFWGEKSKLLRILGMLTAMIAGAGMVLAFSRGAAVAFVLMMLAMVLFRIIKPLQLLAFALVAGILLLAVPQYTNRLVSIQSLTALFSSEPATVTTDGAILGRATEMMAAALVYADHPIVGVGPGMFSSYASEYSQDIALRHIYTNREAHNLLLGLAADSGTLGLVTFLGMLYVTLRDLFMVRKQSQSIRPDLENLSTSFILVLVAYLSTGLFLHLSYMRFFWLMFALASAAAHIGKIELAEMQEKTKNYSPETQGPAS